MDTNIQNISGGVGEAYPGSTGGEFFNYYGTDNNKNEASGDYSSTFGYNNKNTAPKLLMCGSNNQTPGANTNAKGGLIAGYNNNVRAIDGAAICLGGDNVVYGNNQIFIGYDNKSQGSYSPKSICIGRGLIVSFSNLKQKVVLGTYNIDAATLTSKKDRLQTIIGGGDSEYEGHRHNAMEVYSSLNEDSKCCVLFPDQIALSNYTTSNKAYVNAIDPPQDPTNPTTNEQTLATLGSIQALKDAINNAHLQRRQVLVTGQITYLSRNVAYNLESQFSITIPSWANRLRMGIQIGSNGSTQGYTEFGLVSGKYTYTALSTTSENFYIVHYLYDSSNKSITIDKMMWVTSSGYSEVTTETLGLISITAYGNFFF